VSWEEERDNWKKKKKTKTKKKKKKKKAGAIQIIKTRTQTHTILLLLGLSAVHTKHKVLRTPRNTYRAPDKSFSFNVLPAYAIPRDIHRVNRTVTQLGSRMSVSEKDGQTQKKKISTTGKDSSRKVASLSKHRHTILKKKLQKQHVMEFSALF